MARSRPQVADRAKVGLIPVYVRVRFRVTTGGKLGPIPDCILCVQAATEAAGARGIFLLSRKERRKI